MVITTYLYVNIGSNPIIPTKCSFEHINQLNLLTI